MYKKSLDRIETSMSTNAKSTIPILEDLIEKIAVVVAKKPLDADLKLFYDLCKIRLYAKKERDYFSRC